MSHVRLGAPSMKVSVATTIYNERSGLDRLLEGLRAQEGPLEVVAVDAGSTDGTWERLQEVAAQDPRLRIQQRPGCPRGEGFRRAAEMATGDAIAFIGGDDWPDPDWLARLRPALQDSPIVVAGQTMHGPGRFTAMRHVPLRIDGQDIAHPGSATAYRREVLERTGGFDDRFVTAEDMDLNLRAVRAGYTIAQAPDAMVHRNVRGSTGAFLRQQFWNGYGRRQLDLKHGALLQGRSMRESPRRSGGWAWAALRLAAGGLGYLWAFLRERRRHWKD